ncbi:HNH endonuclease family protein [Streptomyces sparsogenes]|uniref:HNH endonuclease family protein n=1 Tax=Streptomyces sparsogenes TaxID=67365 RepID=UPI003323F10A
MQARFGQVLIPGLAALALVSGCSAGDGPGGSGDAGASGGAKGAAGGPALRAVDSLTVKGRAPRTGYERDLFGSSWVDTDDNGCDTRDDILRRDLDRPSFRDGDCLVTSGTLREDPYTGKRLRFVRGHSRIDIDHVVALSDAWQKGAQKWPRDKRVRFANDPLNLIAVDASANRRKGDGDAATWLPPNKDYRCDYVAHQVAVKKKYGVWVTRAEKDAMARVLGGCPETPLPAR